MTKEEFAALLSGRTYGKEITKDEEVIAKELGLIVIIGASDDLVEIYGVEREEIGAYGGTSFMIDANGVLKPRDEIDNDDDVALQDYFFRRGNSKKVEAIFDNDTGYTWTYKTEIPHACFDIFEDGDAYCRGIVIDSADLHVPASQESELAERLAIAEKQIKSLEENQQVLGDILENNSVAMQAAWIEWKNGKGAESAMEWIENTLDGPDLIPDDSDENYHDAQKYFDAHAPKF
ncbi:hypothetical protein ACO0LB_18565 [Undibacterium sp. SXout7W]|uniref:hypothetical protein n=1 Tax=Undibacterium sp. SXout7W TaxID=3413049 RepID=UPI003BF0D5EE